MGILVLLAFFGLLLVMIYKDSEDRFLALVAGTILFPTTALFIKNPSISPQHILLYTFLFLEYWKDRRNFNDSLFKNSLSIPFVLVLFSYTATAFFNSGIASKDMYYGVRDCIDTFGYIMAAYISGKNIDISSFAKKFYPIVIAICIFGIIEGLLNANYPYKIINSAFPLYEGLYNLNGDVGLGQSWRTRACFTTKHPTAFGTLLMSLFLFYLPHLHQQVIVRSKLLLLLALLFICIVVSGSRTALVCTIFGAAVYIIDRFSILAKIAVFGAIAISFSAIMAFLLANFQQSGQGRGSSLDFRTQQLIFSVMAIENSPILGNGNKYTANYILEENDKGEKRAEDSSGQDMGGLESIVFTLLIDRGAVGLFTYYLLLLWMFCIFFKNKNKYLETKGGFALIFAGTAFLTLSGVIGNSSSFLFLFTGVQLGYIKQQQLLEEDGDSPPATEVYEP